MRSKKSDFHLPIQDAFPVAVNHTGEIGIEVEVEGQNLPKGFPSYWNYVVDPSLRGESAEYVLKKPATRDTFKNYLKYLEKNLTADPVKIKNSPRTSVHVHINMNDRTMVQVYNYICLYLVLEDLLIQHISPERNGNLFCLKASDAEALIDMLVKAANTRIWGPDENIFRYSSCNVCAIEKFNSLEFRAMRGTISADEISEWVNILLAIKDVAVEYKDPTEISGEFSILGPEGFIRKVLPEYAGIIQNQIGWRERMWNNLRLVQEIIYSTDWGQQKKKEKRLFALGDDEEIVPDFNLEE